MTIAELTLVAFTLCNSFRVLAYVPQVLKAATDNDGAKANLAGDLAVPGLAHHGRGLRVH